jgi:Pretoxin HINT domain
VPDPRQTLLLVSNAGTETLSVTASHPVRVAGRGWVPAGDLRPGDRVEARDGVLQVLATGVDLRVQPVYNLSVENAETYFVGDLGAWVHNAIVFSIPTPNGPYVGSSKYDDLRRPLTSMKIKGGASGPVQILWQGCDVFQFMAEQHFMDKLGIVPGPGRPNIIRARTY